MGSHGKFYLGYSSIRHRRCGYITKNSPVVSSSKRRRWHNWNCWRVSPKDLIWSRNDFVKEIGEALNAMFEASPFFFLHIKFFSENLFREFIIPPPSPLPPTRDVEFWWTRSKTFCIFQQSFLLSTSCISLLKLYPLTSAVNVLLLPLVSYTL